MSVVLLLLLPTLLIVGALVLLLSRYAERTRTLKLATFVLGLVSVSASYGTYYATSLSNGVQSLSNSIAHFRKPPPLQQGYRAFPVSPEVERFREIFTHDQDLPPPLPSSDQAANERRELARLLLEMGNYFYEANAVRDATASYERSAATFPSGPSYNNLALCYLLTGRTDDGIRYLELSASHVPPSRQAVHNLAAAREHRAGLLIKIGAQRGARGIAVSKDSIRQ